MGDVLRIIRARVPTVDTSIQRHAHIPMQRIARRRDHKAYGITNTREQRFTSAGERGGTERSSFEWSPFFILLFLFRCLFDLIDAGCTEINRQETLNDTSERKSWYSMQWDCWEFEPDSALQRLLTMHGMNFDSWNIIFPGQCGVFGPRPAWTRITRMTRFVCEFFWHFLPVNIG